jgi:hypothetical protein
MKPAFGTMNAKLAKTIARNAPHYQRIVEPFGDRGTFALFFEKRRPRQHILNLSDPLLFGAFQYVQSGNLSQLKQYDWVASPEAFDQAMAITAIDGPDAVYRFLYVKKFGMSMAPGEPPSFDVLTTGTDISNVLYSLPMMRAGLRGVTIVNDDPLSVMGSYGGAGTFLILLPATPEHTEAVKCRLTGLSGDVFFAAKVKDTEEVFSLAKSSGQLKVSAAKVASIMMNTYALVTNYDSGLVPVDPNQMTME